MTTTVAIIGAAGKMGGRISNRLGERPDVELLFVEGTEAGLERLRLRGHEPTPIDDAARVADVVVAAVPDTLIGQVARRVVPLMRAGAMFFCLDPAAPYAGELPDRPDVTYFVTHPSHPPVFNDETTEAARKDYWGGGFAKQSIVSALVQGPEEHYRVGERLSEQMFGPVLRSHRVTLEQMAMLEPALSETVALTCITMMREAMDEAIRRGVPAEAARDFLLGHINVELAIVFEELDWKVSAGAEKAVAEARKVLLQPDWLSVFEPEKVRQSVARIVAG
jgi:D-apionate oxidoisomerase